MLVMVPLCSPPVILATNSPTHMGIGMIVYGFNNLGIKRLGGMGGQSLKNISLKTLLWPKWEWSRWAPPDHAKELHRDEGVEDTGAGSGYEECVVTTVWRSIHTKQ